MILMSKEEYDAGEALKAEMWEMLLWGTVGGKPYVPEPPKPKRWWAIIEIGGKRVTTFMNPDTMETYVTDLYECTNEKIPSFTFIRWARYMDL